MPREELAPPEMSPGMKETVLTYCGSNEQCHTAWTHALNCPRCRAMLLIAMGSVPDGSKGKVMLRAADKYLRSFADVQEAAEKWGKRQGH